MLKNPVDDAEELAMRHLIRLIDILDDNVRVSDGKIVTITVAILEDEEKEEQWQLEITDDKKVVSIKRKGKEYVIDNDRKKMKDSVFYWHDDGGLCERIRLHVPYATTVLSGDIWTSLSKGKWKEGDVGKNTFFMV
jgi:hypothetical protein